MSRDVPFPKPSGCPTPPIIDTTIIRLDVTKGQVIGESGAITDDLSFVHINYSYVDVFSETTMGQRVPVEWRDIVINHNGNFTIDGIPFDPSVGIADRNSPTSFQSMSSLLAGRRMFHFLGVDKLRPVL